MNVSGKTYNVQIGAFNHDPFVRMFKQIQEDFKGKTESYDEFLLERLEKVAVQAILSKDSEVLNSIHRLIEKIREIKEVDDFGSELLNRMYYPASVAVYIPRFPRARKINFLDNLLQKRVTPDSVSIHFEGDKIGEVESNIFTLIPGNYRIEAIYDENEYQLQKEISGSSVLMLNKK